MPQGWAPVPLRDSLRGVRNATRRPGGTVGGKDRTGGTARPIWPHGAATAAQSGGTAWRRDGMIWLHGCHWRHSGGTALAASSPLAVTSITEHAAATFTTCKRNTELASSFGSLVQFSFSQFDPIAAGNVLSVCCTATL
eukprot:gene17553-biopygen10263